MKSLKYSLFLSAASVLMFSSTLIAATTVQNVMPVGVKENAGKIDVLSNTVSGSGTTVNPTLANTATVTADKTGIVSNTVSGANVANQTLANKTTTTEIPAKAIWDHAKDASGNTAVIGTLAQQPVVVDHSNTGIQQALAQQPTGVIPTPPALTTLPPPLTVVPGIPTQQPVVVDHSNTGIQQALAQQPTGVIPTPPALTLPQPLTQPVIVGTVAQLPVVDATHLGIPNAPVVTQQIQDATLEAVKTPTNVTVIEDNSAKDRAEKAIEAVLASKDAPVVVDSSGVVNPAKVTKQKSPKVKLTEEQIAERIAAGKAKKESRADTAVNAQDADLATANLFDDSTTAQTEAKEANSVEKVEQAVSVQPKNKRKFSEAMQAKMAALEPMLANNFSKKKASTLAENTNLPANNQDQVINNVQTPAISNEPNTPVTVLKDVTLVKTKDPVYLIIQQTIEQNKKSLNPETVIHNPEAVKVAETKALTADDKAKVETKTPTVGDKAKAETKSPAVDDKSKEETKAPTVDDKAKVETKAPAVDDKSKEEAKVEASKAETGVNVVTADGKPVDTTKAKENIDENKLNIVEVK